MRIESLKEGVVLALDQLRAEKTRAGLTILGIIIGVATVMAISALIVGIRTSILVEFEAAGPRNFMVMRQDLNEQIVIGPRSRSDRPAITAEEIRRLNRLDAVESAIPGIDAIAGFDMDGQRVEGVQIAGRGAGWSRFTTGAIIAGADFTPADVATARPVVVITAALAEHLFGSLDPIGREIRVGGTPFRVAGVFQPSANVFTEFVQNFAVVPYTAAMRYLDAPEHALALFMVTAVHATQDAAIDQTIATLRSMRRLRPGDENNFTVVTQEELVAGFEQFTAVFFMVMVALSSIGLLVGGVGVIAMMTIAVTERTREIGIRKAVGAQRQEILWQFLVEAVTLTLVGAVVGMLAGGGLALLVGLATPIPAAVPAWAIAAALAMAAFAGIVFGIWPAWRAARMDPVEALRYE